MTSKKNLDLNLDVSSFSDDDYQELWNQIGRIRIKMVEKIGKCNHELGDTFYYQTHTSNQKECAMPCYMSWIYILGEQRWVFHLGTQKIGKPI